MDCDMLVLDDIATLVEQARQPIRVMVVNTSTHRARNKFLNQPQSKYQKNKLVERDVLNNARCRALTPGIC